MHVIPKFLLLKVKGSSGNACFEEKAFNKMYLIVRPFIRRVIIYQKSNQSPSPFPGGFHPGEGFRVRFAPNSS